ncbi:hypothetical protein AXF42_Ash016200 [Apostasia shenzhenica]|uniref:Uncharacterized protein n=1 Tax=Apostasia shenzhenica TaxID=1088818 RepID=A0A2I0AEU9_9ASPA|nr:hypothetical protein AXF42_Ash016200 [Apostasia shenzhenica]
MAPAARPNNVSLFFLSFALTARPRSLSRSRGIYTGIPTPEARRHRAHLPLICPNLSRSRGADCSRDLALEISLCLKLP